MFEDLEQLSVKQFDSFRDLSKRLCGVTVGDGKLALFQNRLGGVARKFDLNFTTMIDALEKGDNKKLVDSFIDKVTTHETYFFREKRHFEYLKNEFYPAKKGKKVKFWSAASSTGEEAWSLAIHLATHHDKEAFEILATDISEACVENCRNATYPKFRLREIQRQDRENWFDESKGGNSGKDLFYRPKEHFHKNITFKQHNLMNVAPITWGPFDIIFLRNVLIYFDKPTQNRIVSNLLGRLNRGGVIIIGHSESLRDSNLPITMTAPTIYIKD